MTDANKQRMLDLLDGYDVAGDGQNKDIADALESFLRNGDSADLIFENIFMPIKELNKSLEDCGYESI